MYHLNAFWPPWFVMWNQLLIILRIPFTPLDKSFHSVPSAFSLSVSFNSLLMIYIILGSYYLLIELLRYVNEFFKTNLGSFGSLSLQILFLPLYLSTCQLGQSLYRYWHAWQCLSSPRRWSFFSCLFVCSSGRTILTHTLLIFKTLTVLLFSHEHFRCNTS